ncbi:MAG: HNH endonuclease [Planctomycetaceae bacterium]
MPRPAPWSPDELLIAFRLYCAEPFGRLHTRNPAVREAAALIGRTPSAVVFKACNFASLDPYHRERGVAGFRNAGRADKALWDEFTADSEQVAHAAEEAHERLSSATATRTLEASGSLDPAPNPPTGPTDIESLIRARRVQTFFRRAVLTSYGHRCAISGVPLPELLNASHIIPWSADEKRRADPRNGLALHALYDRAFDRGLLSFDENRRVMISPALEVESPTPLHRTTLLEIAGLPLQLPTRFPPDEEALAYHRRCVFRDTR